VRTAPQCKRFFELLKRTIRPEQRIATLQCSSVTFPSCFLLMRTLLRFGESVYSPSRHALGEIEPVDDDLSDDQLDAHVGSSQALAGFATVTRANGFCYGCVRRTRAAGSLNQLLRTVR